MVSQFPRPYIIDLDDNIEQAVYFAQQHDLSLDFEWDVVNRNSKGELLHRKDRFARFALLVDQAVQRDDRDTIVIDSLTALAQVLLDKIRVDQGRKFGDEIYGEKSAVGKIIDEPLQIQDWGHFKGFLINAVSLLLSSGKNVVMTAHIKTRENAWGDLIELLNVPTTAANDLGSMFSDVWMLEIENEVSRSGESIKRYIRTTPQFQRQNSLGLGTPLWQAPRRELKLKELSTLLKFNERQTDS